MNEEQLQAKYDALDKALEGVPVESRPAIFDLFGENIKEYAAALHRAAQSESELEKATGPAPLTKEKIMSESNSLRRMQLIRENPELFGPNAVKQKKEFTSKDEIMAIRDGFERRQAIADNPQFFKVNSPQRQEYREDRSNDFQNKFEGSN